MMMKRMGFCLTVFLLTVGCWLALVPGYAVAKPYYEGKTIEIMGESRVGGGTDTVARIIASFLPKYIPGKPGIVVRAQPGAGGSIANNVFYATGKPDGLHLMMNSGSPIALQMRSRDIVKYDLTKYGHIGNINRGSNVILVRKEALKRFYDSKTQPVICGTKEGEEAWMNMLLWGREFLGWNIRWIPGYSGTSDIELAFQRKEVDVFGTTNAYIINRMVNDGTAVAVTQAGIYKNKKYLRRKDFPNVPTFVEVLGDKKPSGLPWQAYLAWSGGKEVDKFLVAPRNTPGQYLTTLITAFRKSTQDPQFGEKIRKMVSEVYEVGVGQETTDLLMAALAAPSEAIDYGRGLQAKFGIIATKK